MKNPRRTVLFTSLALLVCLVAAGLAFRNRDIKIESNGKLQDGSDYSVALQLAPDATQLFSLPDYRIASLSINLHGRPRPVPAAAFAGITDLDPARKPRLMEEGPVLVVTTYRKPPHPDIQWRFLNGSFAQRREVGISGAARNFSSVPERPTIIPPPDPAVSRRTLQAPSLLPSVDPSQTATPSPTR